MVTTWQASLASQFFIENSCETHINCHILCFGLQYTLSSNIIQFLEPLIPLFRMYELSSANLIRKGLKKRGNGTHMEFIVIPHIFSHLRLNKEMKLGNIF